MKYRMSRCSGRRKEGLVPFPGLLALLAGSMCSLVHEGCGGEAPGDLEKGPQAALEFHPGHSRKAEST